MLNDALSQVATTNILGALLVIALIGGAYLYVGRERLWAARIKDQQDASDARLKEQKDLHKVVESVNATYDAMTVATAIRTRLTEEMTMQSKATAEAMVRHSEVIERFRTACEENTNVGQRLIEVAVSNRQMLERLGERQATIIQRLDQMIDRHNMARGGEG